MLDKARHYLLLWLPDRSPTYKNSHYFFTSKICCEYNTIRAYSDSTVTNESLARTGYEIGVNLVNLKQLLLWSER